MPNPQSKREVVEGLLGMFDGAKHPYIDGEFVSEAMARSRILSIFDEQAKRIEELTQMLFEVRKENTALETRLIKSEKALKAREGECAELRKQYDELIYAVGTKFPDESRHQTALRYIVERERKGEPLPGETKSGKPIKEST